MQKKLFRNIFFNTDEQKRLPNNPSDVSFSLNWKKKTIFINHFFVQFLFGIPTSSKIQLSIISYRHLQRTPQRSLNKFQTKEFSISSTFVSFERDFLKSLNKKKTYFYNIFSHISKSYSRYYITVLVLSCIFLTLINSTMRKIVSSFHHQSVSYSFISKW